MITRTRANIYFLEGKHKEALDAYLALVDHEEDPIAAANAAYMYHRGIAVEQDFKEAMNLYQLASLLDGGVSCYNMALMYLRGQGVAVDFEKAIKLMRQSADLGCANAILYLGNAYVLGCAYDPLEIECLSLIPFYTVIYRDFNTAFPLLEGRIDDPSLEDKRFAVIEADGDDAIEMYRALLQNHRDDPYIEEQYSSTSLLLGQAMIEGLGNCYNPEAGYRRIYRTAILHSSAEAAQFLLEHAEEARAYQIDVDRIARLLTTDYFKPVAGSLKTPEYHNVPLLLPKKE